MKSKINPIKLTDKQVFIYGMPNFKCAAIAKLLIEAEIYDKGPNKAEYEQAVFIHWAASMHQEHGCNVDLSSLLETIKVKLQLSKEHTKRVTVDANTVK